MSEHFNGLTAAEAELLACLAEECGEVVQVIGKVLRHGYDDYSPHDTTKTTNRINLEKELGDLIAVKARMINAGALDNSRIDASRRAKHLKLRSWTHHQPDSEVFK